MGSQICPLGVADHVNLGLIPSCESSWSAACKALNQTRGGILHIHGNVDIRSTDDFTGQEANRNLHGFNSHASTNEWTARVLDGIKKIVDGEFGQGWHVTILNVVKVKSYGPRVDHMVVDIEVRPDNGGSPSKS